VFEAADTHMDEWRVRLVRLSHLLFGGNSRNGKNRTLSPRLTLVALGEPGSTLVSHFEAGNHL